MTSRLLSLDRTWRTQRVRFVGVDADRNADVSCMPLVGSFQLDPVSTTGKHGIMVFAVPCLQRARLLYAYTYPVTL